MWFVFSFMCVSCFFMCVCLVIIGVVHVDDVTISYSHLQLQLFDFVVSKPEFKVYKVQSPCRQ